MDATTNTLLMLAASIGSYLLVIGLLVRLLMPPVGRKLFLVLSAFEVFFIFMHLMTRGEQHFWTWLFDPNSELALGAAFSAGQYAVVAMATLLIGLRGEWDHHWQRLYWLLMTAVFVFLGLDEYFSLHETVANWRVLYPAAGVIVVSLTLAAFWFTFRQYRWVVLFVLVGIGTMGFAGVGLDAFINQNPVFGPISLNWFVCPSDLPGIPCTEFSLVEEFLEMCGVSLILSTMFSFARIKTRADGWRLNQRLLGATALLWAFWAVGNVAIFPGVERLLLARDAHATYADSPLEMLGYRISKDVAAPGDDIHMTLFYRVNRRVNVNYYLSAHLLSRPDAESIAQNDIQLGDWKFPTTAWIPGVIIRNRLDIRIPHDLPDGPASYWIAIRSWTAEDEEHITPENLHGLPIETANRPMPTSDTLTLVSLPVLREAITPDVPPMQASYDFAGDFALTGYSLPERAAAGDSLPLAFWWHTGKHVQIDADYVQFVHLFNTNGVDYYVSDRTLFDGRFPASDWPGGITIHDDFGVPLPEDLPPGEYRIQTGLYRPDDYNRIEVHDADGNPVQDYSIVLGTVTVEEPQ